jgi:hypothetical protein
VTADEWLLSRDPAPPPSLAERLRLVLAAAEDPGRARPAADVYLTAGEALLGELLRDGCVSRESALDLLTADALVTYAFEAASAEPARLEARAQRAMARIAALGGERPA